jgi:hypothetical protein
MLRCAVLPLQRCILMCCAVLKANVSKAASPDHAESCRIQRMLQALHTAQARGADKHNERAEHR